MIIVICLLILLYLLVTMLKSSKCLHVVLALSVHAAKFAMCF